MGFLKHRSLWFMLLLILETCIASSQHLRKINPGFRASYAEWKNTSGLFLLSNNSEFALGFYNSLDVTLFSLGVIHVFSSKVVWTANRYSMINSTDEFVFEEDGNVYLEGGDRVVWSTGTKGKNAISMELQNAGNLLLLSENGTILWQSFDHPTDTLLSGQMFWEGMQLKSYPNDNNLSNFLGIKSGDLVLYAGYRTPQIYWSIANDSRKTNKSVIGQVKAMVFVSNSWHFYDQTGTLLWQFIISENSDWNVTWAAVLGTDGLISFYNLHKGKSILPESTLPQSYCSTPEPCDPYFVCYFDNICQCPSILSYKFNCKPPTIPTCNNRTAELLYVGDNLNYFALAYITPFMKSNLTACKEACLQNCSCLVLFFDNNSGSCYFFDQIGSFQRFEGGSGGYTSYMKIFNNEDGGPRSSPPRQATRNIRKHVVIMTIILTAAALTVVGIHIFCWYRRKLKELLRSSEETSEEDTFLDNLSGMPVRFKFSQLRRATKNFSTKVGQGGFGSVYLGLLPDGTRLAVKKLERIGQGVKEFRAEVGLIGSTHHVHLVKLKGFCSEGVHRLLVYEYMGNGSLDKWIFKNSNEGLFLDWDTRFKIALGTAKALAYLHHECEVKIVHCDIKPENVLLDDNFVAKVSDFGLAKLMNREQSFVCTQLRGTRGYVAPEWITNLAISDKSDVYSYGMVLLEIIGGRKNYDPGQSSEKVHFPPYAFKMLEERKFKEILDPKLEVEENDARVETAITVALWCIQEEMHLRPPMTRVVQMLEGLSVIPPPPTSSQLGSRSSFSWSSGIYTTALHSYFSDVRLSDVRLSGPR